MPRRTEKTEPIRLAEIDRRVKAMTPQGRTLLRAVLAEDVPWIDLGSIQQILTRHHGLSKAGRAWVAAVVAEETAVDGEGEAP